MVYDGVELRWIQSFCLYVALLDHFISINMVYNVVNLVLECKFDDPFG